MTSSPQLAAIFRAHARAGAAAPDESLLVDVYEAARSRWPDLALSAQPFIRHVAERLPAAREGRTVEQALRSLHLVDLYLACACAAGVPGAVEALEREHLARVPALLARQRRSPEAIQEVCQKVRETLLVRARISTYSGEGKLSSWIEVIAKRLANKEGQPRSGAPASSDSGIAGAVADGGDLEKDVIKKKLVAELQVAVREAGSVLSAEQRELLRFHYRNGMSESRLAKLFNTSQPTISRRLSKAKELVFAETRRSLRQRLQLTERDFDSVIDEIRSRWLDLSLGQVFGGPDGPGPSPA
ncbi:MAG TPA: sigma-70 family RNA polymerase sigma factor [Myxococcales bacterium]|nr:sigma-70 family RNA polymerase sigma factor [Myxococcales bacterium]